MADFRSLAATLRRYRDPAASADPVVSALVARLAALPDAPGPSPAFRAELGAQLVAVTPRLVAEGVGADVPRARPGRRVRAAWRRAPLRRPLAVVATLVAIFAVLLTGAVWLSSSSLPGDSLYGVKRASESVQLSLTSGAGPRGREYLSLAKKRADEVSALLSRVSALAVGSGPLAAGGVNAHTAKLVTDTLDDADSDIRDGTRLLTGKAVHDMSDDPLRSITDWAPDQISRLSSTADHIPLGTLHDRATSSVQLAQRVLDRADQLRDDMGCSCLTSTPTDELGPLPCAGLCSPTATPPPGPGQHGPPSLGATTGAPKGTSSGITGRPTGGSSPATVTSGAASLPRVPGLPGSATSSTPGSSGSSTAPDPDPTGATSSSGGAAGLPLPHASSTPITVDSCGLTITLGSIGIGLGPCGVNLHL